MKLTRNYCLKFLVMLGVLEKYLFFKFTPSQFLKYYFRMSEDKQCKDKQFPSIIFYQYIICHQNNYNIKLVLLIHLDI